MPAESAAARAAAEAEAAEAAALAAEGGIGAKIGNALTLAGLAGSAFFGYYTYKYTTNEMEASLDELTEGGEVAPWTAAWVATMEQYLRVRRKVEGWVKDYADPPTDKLLPDIPPNIMCAPSLSFLCVPAPPAFMYTYIHICAYMCVYIMSDCVHVSLYVFEDIVGVDYIRLRSTQCSANSIWTGFDIRVPDDSAPVSQALLPGGC